jgi:hypothetical protein|tara:strand:- start:234 stop:386 length:153 start_codon:yes stop_codon:yes gene_type:complete
MKQSLILQIIHKRKKRNKIDKPIIIYCIVSGKSVNDGSKREMEKGEFIGA